jgi:hypothetical protein
VEGEQGEIKGDSEKERGGGENEGRERVQGERERGEKG